MDVWTLMSYFLRITRYRQMQHDSCKQFCYYYFLFSESMRINGRCWQGCGSTSRTCWLRYTTCSVVCKRLKTTSSRYRNWCRAGPRRLCLNAWKANTRRCWIWPTETTDFANVTTTSARPERKYTILCRFRNLTVSLRWIIFLSLVRILLNFFSCFTEAYSYAACWVQSLKISIVCIVFWKKNLFYVYAIYRITKFYCHWFVWNDSYVCLRAGELGSSTGSGRLWYVDSVRRLRRWNGCRRIFYNDSVQPQISAGQHFTAPRTGTTFWSCSWTSGNMNVRTSYCSQKF